MVTLTLALSSELLREPQSELASSPCGNGSTSSRRPAKYTAFCSPFCWQAPTSYPARNARRRRTVPAASCGRGHSESATALARRRPADETVEKVVTAEKWQLGLGWFPSQAVVILADDLFTVSGNAGHPLIAFAAILTGFVAGSLDAERETRGARSRWQRCC